MRRDRAPRFARYSPDGSFTSSTNVVTWFSPDACPEEFVQNDPKDLTCEGNPVACESGAKVMSEVDYQSPGDDSLRFARRYSSQPESDGEEPTPWVTPGWGMTDHLSFRLIKDTSYGRLAEVRHLKMPRAFEELDENARPSVNQVRYLFVGGGTATELNSSTQAHGRVQLIDGAWTWITAKGERVVFGANGQPSQRQLPGGQTVNYQWQTLASGQPVLTQITGHSGRRLHLAYNDGGQLISLTDPAGQVTGYDYDAVGNLVTVIYPDDTPNTDADNPRKHYHYEDSRFPHHLTGITDENGHRYASYAYDEQGRAILSTHADNADKTTFNYPAPGITDVQRHLNDTEAHELTYHIDRHHGRDRITRIEHHPCPDCTVGTETREYNNLGWLIRKVDAAGMETRYNRDAKGQQTRRTEAVGTPEERVIDTRWHNTWGVPTSINHNGRSTSYSYDNHGRLVRITDAGRATYFTYNDDNRLIQSRDPGGASTFYDYDPQGNLIRVTNPLGHETTLGDYDPHGRAGRITDPNGLETVFSYTPRGWLASVFVDGARTEFQYDPAGLLHTVTGPTGDITHYDYDPAQRLIAVEDGQGNRLEYTLDYRGNRTETRLLDAQGQLVHRQSQRFNALNQRVALLDAADALRADYEYDPLGRLTREVRADGAETHYQHDPLGRLVAITDALNGLTGYDYNARDELTGVTDPTGLTTGYTVDTQGQVTHQDSPDTGTTSYEYDNAGNRTSSTDSRGIVTDYTYDDLNRLTQVQYPADPSQNVTFSYDDTRDGNPGIGRLTGLSDASGSTTYRYNALGQVTEKIVTVDTDIGPTTGSVHYQYDAAGQLTQITYPSGRVVDYTLDSQGRPQAIHTRDHDQAAPDTLIDNIHYRPFGPPEAYDYGNGLNHRRDYDLDYRLTQIQVSGTEPLLSRQYQYDAAGNITAIDNPVNPQASQSFAYDALDRLTQAEGLYGQESFTYDPVGNRLSRSHQSPNTQIEESYGYAPDSHRLLYLDQSTDGLPSLTRDFVYDEAGNPTLRTGADGAEQGFTYNAANRMAQAEIDYQVTAQYTHNALGQRVHKTVDGLPEPTESLVSEVPGAQGRLRGLENQRAAAQRRLERLQEQRQQRPARHHERLQSQIDDQRERLAHIDEQIGELTLTPRPDIPPEQITHYNEQGQRLGDYTDTGEPLREYLYFDSLLVGLVDYTDPSHPNGVLYHIHNDHLGTPQMATDASQQIVWQGDYHPFGKVIPNPNNSINLLARFPGQYSDGETGLYYNYFRDYDPSLGRYVQGDPIGLAGGINIYAYANSNPLSFIDSFGLYTLSDAIASLRNRGVTRDNPRGRTPSYSKEQIFDEWLRLEREDMSWLNELPDCPQTLDECGDDDWNSPSEANSLHPGGVYEVRSKTTPGGHSNQCIYDANGNLMTGIPAAGSADYVSCPNPPFCSGHFFHDVKPFSHADDLERIDDYYSVRPVR